MWYQIARLITVQIGLLLSCFCSIAVATIGYVAAILLVKIKEEEVGGRVKFQEHLQEGLRSDVGSSVKVEDRPDSARSGRVLVAALIVREGAAAR
jgi:hypothetical protein